MHVINNAKLQFIKLWLIALEMTHDATQGFDSPLEGLNANNEPSHWVLWDLFWLLARWKLFMGNKWPVCSIAQ